MIPKLSERKMDKFIVDYSTLKYFDVKGLFKHVNKQKINQILNGHQLERKITNTVIIN
jgi:hypothetical protein